MDIGFIGLGHMGLPMARNLLKAGHRVVVYNRTRSRAEPLVNEGAIVAASPAEASAGEAVITMLANHSDAGQTYIRSSHRLENDSGNRHPLIGCRGLDVSLF